MARRFQLIAFDADDTLWHNESIYAETQASYRQILSAYHPDRAIEDALFRVETRNLPYYGYGIKSFALSMIETAVELSNGQISAAEIMQIIGLARQMLQSEVKLLPHVEEALARLKDHYDLVVITKGDLLDQEAKLERSGLKPLFKHFETVSDKTPERYVALLARLRVLPEHFLMVGNSLRSDILPVVAVGGTAVFVPYELTWAHEHIEAVQAPYHQIEHLGQLPGLLAALEDSTTERQADESSARPFPTQDSELTPPNR